MTTAQRYPPPEDDWWRVGPGNVTCRKCGEDRLTTKVEDARGVQIFCSVCSWSWWVSRRVVKHGDTGE